MAFSMKQIFIFPALLFYFSSTLSMAKDPAANIKRQLAQLKAEGLDKTEIAQIATNSLRALLEYPLLHFPLEMYIDQYKALVEAGGDKNVCHPKNGKTALMFAALDSRTDIMQALLGLGVDPQIQDNYGQTALNSLEANLIIDPSTHEETNLLLTQVTQKPRIS